MEAYILTRDESHALKTFYTNTPVYTRRLHEAKLFSDKKIAERFNDFWDLNMTVRKVSMVD